MTFQTAFQKSYWCSYECGEERRLRQFHIHTKCNTHRWLKTKSPVIGFDHLHLPATLAQESKDWDWAISWGLKEIKEQMKTKQNSWLNPKEKKSVTWKGSRRGGHVHVLSPPSTCLKSPLFVPKFSFLLGLAAHLGWGQFKPTCCSDNPGFDISMPAGIRFIATFILELRCGDLPSDRFRFWLHTHAVLEDWVHFTFSRSPRFLACQSRLLPGPSHFPSCLPRSPMFPDPLSQCGPALAHAILRVWKNITHLAWRVNLYLSSQQIYLTNTDRAFTVCQAQC